MEYLARQRLLMTRNKLNDVFPTRTFETNSKLFFIKHDEKNSAIGAMWLCHPLSGIAEDTTRLLESALNSDFPDETMISFQIVSSTLVDPLIQYYYLSRKKVIFDESNPEKAELVNQLTESRIDLMRKGAIEPIDTESGIKLKDKYLIITAKFPVALSPKEEDYQKMNVHCISLEQAFDSIGLYPQRQNHHDYLQITRSILNPGKHPSTDYDEYTELNDQIFTYEDDIKVDRDVVAVNEHFVKSLSVQRYPKQTALPIMGLLLGDPKGSQNQIACPFLLTTTLYFPNSHGKRQSIEKQAKSMKFQNMGGVSKYQPMIGIKDENYSMLTEAIQKGEKPVMCWTNLLVFGETKDESVRMSSKAKNYYEVQGFKLSEDRYFHGPAFQQQLPFCMTKEAVKFSKRFNTMTVEHAVHILPVAGDWKGNGIGANNMFYSRRGQVILYDPYDSETNMNGCIFGESGSGKSVLAQDICLGVWQRNGIVRIIDSGRSYKKITDIVKGEFIEFTPERKIVLNPFTDIKDIIAEIPPLLSILEQMAAPKDGLNDYQMRMLEKHTIEAFEIYGNELTITELSEHLIAIGSSDIEAGEINKLGNTNGDLEIKKIGEQMFPYTRHGSFGKYFDGPANLSMSGDWSVLELDDLQDLTELRTIALMLLITKLNKDFYHGDRKRIKILLVDEFWKFLLEKDSGSERIQKYLIGAFRLFRKFNAASFIASQAPTDITEPAILQNAANIIILKQKKETVDKLETDKIMSLNAYTFDMMRQLTTKKGKYSELFITTSGRGQGFARFAIDRFSQLIYSTDPFEVSNVNERMAEGNTLVQAVNSIIEEENSQKIEPA
jgi:conjugal transfer ATP-binding protein TraC|tara:strand:+ start:3757 stop:6261 length:2505 start_codon:yes stop_codon:yes gene_type:complete